MLLAWILFFLLYGVVLACLISVSLFRKNIGGAYITILLWTTTYIIWFWNSPMYKGDVLLIKSIDRSPFEGHVIRNWGDTSSCKPEHVLKAESVADIMAVLDNDNIRVVGRGHSWSPLVCGEDTVISLNYCTEPVLINNIIEVDAGCHLEYVNDMLNKHDRVLYGIGGIQYQTVAGSLMTALHGSQYKDFGSHVVKLTAILANKTMINVTDDLHIWRSSMGMLGIVTKVYIQTYPIVSIKKTCKVTNYEEALSELNKTHFGVTLDSYWGFHQDSVEMCLFDDPVEENVAYKKSSDISFFFSFVYDNVIIPSTILLSRIIRLIDVTDIASHDYTVRKSILDAWKIVPGYGYISAEYSVPLSECNKVVKEMQKLAYPNFVAVYIRRLNASTDLMAFAKETSCIIDTSWLEYQYVNTQDKIRNYHTEVEKLISTYNGNTHWGKYYASDTKKIHLDETFKTYRMEIDPSNKFMNSYTTELITGLQDSNRYDDFAINQRGLPWRILWWFTFSVAILSSIWYVNDNGYTRLMSENMYRYNSFYLVLVICITVIALLENNKVSSDFIKILSVCIYGIGIFGFSLLLWENRSNLNSFHKLLLPPYGILQFTVLLVWTIDQFHKFHEVTQEDLKVQDIYDGHTLEDIVFYSGILMVCYAIICAFFKKRNPLEFWYHWIQFAFFGTFSAFVSLSTHATYDEDGYRNGHGHLWWLPIIGGLLI